MRQEAKRKFYWRKLDDQAKVFALASSKSYSSVFRLSIVLKEKIESKILQEAVEIALERYKAYRVKMKRGLFWYYFEENEKQLIVSLENEYPFKRINTRKNNDYLFKVTYFENKINVEFYHALTDGNSGSEFLKEIVYRYLELRHPNELERAETNKQPIIKDSENAYVKNYKKRIKNSNSIQIGYMMKGKRLPKGNVAINHFNIDLEKIKDFVRHKNCTLSNYLIAMVIYSIYIGNYKKNKGKRPINICVPFNMKKYFETDTVSNFFSYMVISAKLENNKEYDFEDILNIVKKQYKSKKKSEKLIETMSANVKSINNICIRIIPLVIKKIAIRIGSMRVKRNFTMTFSNIGKIEIENKYKKYIESILTILSPDWCEKIKCGICSYENNLVISFGSILNNVEVEQEFKKILEKENISFYIQGNQVNIIK